MGRKRRSVVVFGWSSVPELAVDWRGCKISQWRAKGRSPKATPLAGFTLSARMIFVPLHWSMRPLQRTAILGLVICRPDGRRRSVSQNDLHHAFGERARKVATKLGQRAKSFDRNRPGADPPGNGNIKEILLLVFDASANTNTRHSCRNKLGVVCRVQLSSEMPSIGTVF